MMKRKLILLGAAVLLILAAVVVVAGRKGLGRDDRRKYDEVTVTPDGKLVVKPGDRPQWKVVIDAKAENSSTNNPAPSR